MAIRNDGPSQCALVFRTWGGPRAGSGRKPRLGASRVAHRKRPKLSAYHPVHVTVKMRRGVPNLRVQRVFAAVRVQLGLASRPAFRLVEWSVQFDHLHLLVEADDERALSRGMARLNGALARAVNAVARRKGRAVRERYHARALRSPREVRNAVRYVLNNGYKHKVIYSGVDPMSSGPMFDGWQEAHGSSRKRDSSTCAPQTWLLRVAWRRHGLIPLGPC